MNVKPSPEENYVLSWSDLRIIFQRSKRKILYGALICSLLAAFYTLSRDVTYLAQGTFREKNKQSNSSEKSLSALLLSGGATAAESMAITTIKSRRVLEKVVQQLSLQGNAKPKDERGYIAQKLSHYAENIYDNIRVEEAYFFNKYKPVVKDPHQELAVKEITYDGEVGLSLELHFINGEQFKIYNIREELIGQGTIGQPVKLPQAEFTISKKIAGPLSEKIYIVSLSPLHRVAQNLLGNLVVEADKLDKTLLKISYNDNSRHRASKLLNTVMSTYREFLVDEHVRVTADQVAYLKSRQEDMDKQLVTLMEDHAINIASNDASIEFLVKSQQNYKTKLLNIDLEIKHLEKAQREGIAFFERHSADGDSPVVQNLLGEIRRYRQQADTLEIALRNTHISSPDDMQNRFNHYVEELQETHQASQDARELLAEVERGRIVQPSGDLLANAKYLVKPWHEKMEEAQQQKENAASVDEQNKKNEEFENNRLHYAAYLANLLHLFDVQEKTIQDRLTHQQNLQTEFQGIDLETANSLYIGYSKELHSLEADLAQKEFIIQQLNQPEFEVSSINSIMDDTISREIINKTSSLMLVLKDEPNRTTKELERLKRDIDIQKGFLIVHLKQMCDIIRLREQLLEDKIHSLQNIILELVRQKISIQETHLVDYINSRLNNLKHERHVISQHQKELQDELDQLPEKWASQKLIDQHMQSNVNIVHQIASMIESKTIAENLEVSQSAPFDNAVTPVLPKNPRLLLFMAIGAIGGAFFTFCFCLLQSAARGVEATRENLDSLNQQVGGKLSHRSDYDNIENLSQNDLETIRKLAVQISPPEGEEKVPRTVVLIEGHGPRYAAAFGALMAKRGQNILLLPLSFHEEAADNQKPGLLDLLEGRAHHPKIVKGLYFDYIAPGGSTPFATELLESIAFQNVLKQFSEQYDWVIGYSEAAPVSAEALCLLKIFQNAAVTLSGEKIEELKPYFDASRNGKKISFLLI